MHTCTQYITYNTDEWEGLPKRLYPALCIYCICDTNRSMENIKPMVNLLLNLVVAWEGSDKY